MKKAYLITFTLLLSLFSHAQKTDINVDLLSDLIAAKQAEIKQRVLSDIVVKNIEETNYVTYNTIYNIVDILTTEKNKTVITQNITRQIIEYTFSYGLTRFIMERYPSGSDKLKFNLSTFVDKQKQLSSNREDMYSVKVTTSKEWQLFNYMVDTIHKLLSKDAVFQKCGLFQKKDSYKYFTDGFGNMYPDLTSSEKASYNLILTNVFNDISGSLTSAVDIYGNLKQLYTSFSKNEINLNNFDDINEIEMKSIMMLFGFSMEVFKDLGDYSFIYIIGTIVDKYVVYDLSSNEKSSSAYTDFTFDVEAMIISLGEEFYNKRSSLVNCNIGFKPFFTIGLNYAAVPNANNVFTLNSEKQSINNLYTAGEKIGVKFILSDRKYTRQFGPNELFKYKGNWISYTEPKRKSVYNNIYVSFYGSGIIYNIVNLTSEQDFTYPIFGIGPGIEFFNDLEFNFSYAIAVDFRQKLQQNLNRSMISFGFDIPIFEYIKATKSNP